MDFYFENVGKPDIRAMTEVRYRIGSAKYWCWVGLYFSMAAYYFWNYTLGYGFSSLMLLLIVGLIYMLLMPYLQARKAMKQHKVANHGHVSGNVIRFGEKIWMEGVDFTRTWEYHNLAKVYSLKYCYCLRFVDKSGFMLSRDNFTKGTFAEFKQFLRTKRPDLKIPE